MQIGNAVINQETDTRGQYDFLSSHAIISDETAHDINKFCDFSLINQPSKCNAALDKADSDTYSIDEYNIYAALCHNDNLTTLPKQSKVRSKFNKTFFFQHIKSK